MYVLMGIPPPPPRHERGSPGFCYPNVDRYDCYTVVACEITKRLEKLVLVFFFLLRKQAVNE